MGASRQRGRAQQARGEEFRQQHGLAQLIDAHWFTAEQRHLLNTERFQDNRTYGIPADYEPGRIGRLAGAVLRGHGVWRWHGGRSAGRVGRGVAGVEPRLEQRTGQGRVRIGQHSAVGIDRVTGIDEVGDLLDTQ